MVNRVDTIVNAHQQPHNISECSEWTTDCPQETRRCPERPQLCSSEGSTLRFHGMVLARGISTTSGFYRRSWVELVVQTYSGSRSPWLEGRQNRQRSARSKLPNDIRGKRHCRARCCDLSVVAMTSQRFAGFLEETVLHLPTNASCMQNHFLLFDNAPAHRRVE